MELSMSDTKTVSRLRQRMIEDMAARKLNPHTQRGHISSCKRFAAWLKRSPDTATPDEVRRFQLRCPAGAQLPATSCLGAFWTPVS
jgi:integrase/recombinase XerD